MSRCKLLISLFTLSLSFSSSAYYTVEDVIHNTFIVIEGQTYEVSSSCAGKFAEVGDEVLFTTISAHSAHCDHVLAKNKDNGKFCQLFCY